MNTKKAILTISIGNRHFTKYTFPSITAYSKKINSDLILHNSITIHSKILNEINKFNFQRKNILPYIQKIASIHALLDKYEKLLFLDDSCIISKKAEDIFSICPDFGISAYEESEHEEFKSHHFDRNFIYKRRNLQINKYFNAGVIIVNRDSKDIFSNKNILDNIDLFESKYPVQAYLNYAINNYNINTYSLEEEWNFMAIEEYAKYKNRKLNRLSKEYIKSILNNKIFHITGYYENRINIIKQLSHALNHSSHPHCFFKKILMMFYNKHISIESNQITDNHVHRK